MLITNEADSWKVAIAADFSAVATINEKSSIFFVDEDNELSVISTTGSTIAVPEILPEKILISIAGIQKPVKVSSSLKSLGAVAYDEQSGENTNREIRIYYANESNILSELCQSFQKKGQNGSWTLTKGWRPGHVGGGTHQKKLAATSSISASITPTPYQGHVYPFVEIFYTSETTPDQIACAYVGIKDNSRGWFDRTVGPRPADHVERIQKEKPSAPRPEPAPAPKPFPSTGSEEFTHYHITVALGFGFVFGLVAGLVLDRPFWGHYHR